MKIKYYKITVTNSGTKDFLYYLNEVKSLIEDKKGELIIQKVKSDYSVNHYLIKTCLPASINENFLNAIPMLCKIIEFKEKKIYSFFANLFKGKENNNENNI